MTNAAQTLQQALQQGPLFLRKMDPPRKVFLTIRLRSSDYRDVHSSEEQVANYSAGESGNVLLLCGA